MITASRPFEGMGRYRSQGAFVFYTGAAGPRPGTGGAPMLTVPMPMAIPGTDIPFSGMDPSNPATYTRPWNPATGMIARLNFDGAMMQGNTSTGGVYQAPARRRTQVAARPARRPR